MSLSSWFHNIEFIAPLVLPLIPGFPAQLTPYVVKGIQTAETIQGASGPEKLAKAVDEVNNGIAAINAIKPDSVNAFGVNAAIVSGINTVVAVANVVKHPAAQPKV